MAGPGQPIGSCQETSWVLGVPVTKAVLPECLHWNHETLQSQSTSSYLGCFSNKLCRNDRSLQTPSTSLLSNRLPLLCSFPSFLPSPCLPSSFPCDLPSVLLPSLFPFLFFSYDPTMCWALCYAVGI